MITVGNVYAELNRFAPFDRAADFDNVGLLVGSADAEVKCIGIALDITGDTVRQAAGKGCDLIVSHHPVIMEPVKSIDPAQPLYLLIREGISVISAHTNLDSAPGGVNDCLAQALGLEDVRLPAADVTGVLRQGELRESTEPRVFAGYVKQALGCSFVEYVDGKKPVKSVVVGGGSCSSLFSEAISSGADAMLTSDVKYHTWLTARELGFTLLDAGHFDTECVVKPTVAALLKERFPALDIKILDENRPTEVV